MPEYTIAWNYTYHSGRLGNVKDVTAHKIKERDGRDIVAECGVEFGTLVPERVSEDESAIEDDDKCGRCWR